MQKQTPAPVLTIRFRAEQFKPYGWPLGIFTDAHLATRIGVDRSTIWRLMNGATPKPQTIAAFLRAFPDRKFEDLFEVTSVSTPRVRAA